MIGKLAEHIDKESFMRSLDDIIPKHEQIIVDLFVSNTCNLHCKHCYFLDYKPQEAPLSLQQWYDIINESINVGIRHFHFSGKEPFGDQRIPLILNRLNQLSRVHNLKYGLVTNGTLLKRAYLLELIDSNLSYVEFSLEGDMEYNRTIRGTNSFESIYSLIKDIPNKSKLNITSTYFGNNLHDLEIMIDKFINIGVTKFNIAPYLKFDKDVLLPVEELDFNQMIELKNHFHHYLETIKAESIDIRLCLTRKQAYEMFMHSNSLSDDIEQYIYNRKKMIYELGKNVLEVNYPLLYIPFLTQIIITNDGVIIPCSDDIHYKNLKEISIGNIKDSRMETVMVKRRDFILTYINQKFKDYEKD